MYPRADLELRSLLLSSDRYSLHAGARLSTIVLALGWGPMSDQSLLDHLDISQGGRWFFLRWDQPLPIDETRLFRSAANMHLVPAEGWVEKVLKDARPGEVILLRGLLVDAQDDNGWSWQSSLSRDDRGAGSCELLYVEYAQLERGL
jgi:hypothetical protein